MSKHITLLHQDQELLHYYDKLFTQRGYSITTLDSEFKLIDSVKKAKTDLIISSYELPSIDGETLFKELSKLFPGTPVILLGTTKSEALITRMLLQTNCEFMLLPIAPAELVARVNALLTHKHLDDESNELSYKDLILDKNTKKAIRDKQEIELSPTEYKLLEYLMENAECVLTRDMILSAVWDSKEDVTDRVVDVYVGYLRNKVDEAHNSKLIHTARGFGYYLGEK